MGRINNNHVLKTKDQAPLKPFTRIISFNILIYEYVFVLLFQVYKCKNMQRNYPNSHSSQVAEDRGREYLIETRECMKA